MTPEQSKKQVQDYAKTHGLSEGDAYYQIQEMCEAQREVWDFGVAAGRDERGRTIDVVFDGPPGHESGRFVEVEQDGKSIKLGEWIKRPDGLWALRIQNVG